jgi:hypothetical protein
VGDDSVAPKDAGQDALADASDATIVESGTDASDASDAATTTFCTSPTAAGAAFCADFETVLNPGDGWDNVSTTAGTLGLDSMGAAGSARSALFTMSNAPSCQVIMRKSVKAGTLRAKAIVDFDAYFAFPAWNAASDGDEFLTLVFTTANQSGSYYVDIERFQGVWQTTNTGGATKTFADPGLNAWHHFTISWNGTAAPVQLIISIDQNPVVNTTLPQYGSTAAPLTFDTLGVNADAESLSTTPATQVRYDNVIVRFP